MTVENFEFEDRLPMAVVTLQIAAEHLKVITFKFVLKDHYPDLRGLVPTYADALEYEFKLNSIPYEREKKYNIQYKDIVLQRYYFSDFTVFGSIILEMKAIEKLSSSEIKQTLNYLAASKNKIGLLINFGEDSLNYKRIIL